jgi:tRNA (cytidine/uridine-2'-O-)-methyltransferase
MEDKLLQRAGLDYHEYAEIKRYADWDTFIEQAAPARDRMFAFTTRGSHLLGDQRWQAGDWLVFVSETAGLSPALRESFPLAQRVRLPMRAGQRSLNLSNAVAVAVFDAWRQTGFDGGV